MTFKVEDIVASDDQNMIFDERKIILRAQKLFDGCGSEEARTPVNPENMAFNRPRKCP